MLLRTCLRLGVMLAGRQPEIPAAASHTSSAVPDVSRVEKAALRSVVKRRLKQMSDTEMATESAHCTLLSLLPSYCARGLWQQLKAGLQAGQEIAERVLASGFFQRAERVGVYIHCAQLREVDTRPLLEALLSAGAHAVGRAFCVARVPTLGRHCLVWLTQGVERAAMCRWLRTRTQICGCCTWVRCLLGQPCNPPARCQSMRVFVFGRLAGRPATSTALQHIGANDILRRGTAPRRWCERLL